MSSIVLAEHYGRTDSFSNWHQRNATDTLPTDTHRDRAGRGGDAEWSFIQLYLLLLLLLLCKMMCTVFIFYVCFSPHLVQLVTSIYTESSGGSQPAKPGVSVKHSIVCKPQFYNVTKYWFELAPQKEFWMRFLCFRSCSRNWRRPRRAMAHCRLNVNSTEQSWQKR